MEQRPPDHTTRVTAEIGDLSGKLYCEASLLCLVKVQPALYNASKDWILIDLFSTVKQGLPVEGVVRGVIIFHRIVWSI